MFIDKEKRKQISIEKLKKLDIVYDEELPPTYCSKEVVLKSKEDIAKRFITNIISIQVAYELDAKKQDIDESIKIFNDLLVKYNAIDNLNYLEKSMFDKTASKEDIYNLTWQYECLDVLIWALKLKENLSFPSGQCDVNYLVDTIIYCKNFNEFIDKCDARDIEEILDELDLEYRYNWATVENKIDNSVNIGELSHEVVIERRRALEWLVSKELDWNNIEIRA